MPSIRYISHWFYVTFMLLFFKPEFIKETYSKDQCPDNSKFLYPNKYRFYFLNDRFRLNNPQTILNRQLQPLKYDYPYHPNLGSTPRVLKISKLKKIFRAGRLSVKANWSDCCFYCKLVISYTERFVLLLV